METAQKAKTATIISEKLSLVRITIDKLDKEIKDISTAILDLSSDQLIAGEAIPLIELKQQYQFNRRNALQVLKALESELEQQARAEAYAQAAELKQQTQLVRDEVVELLAKRDELLKQALTIEKQIDQHISRQQTIEPIAVYAQLGSRLGKVLTFQFSSDGRLFNNGTIGGVN